MECQCILEQVAASLRPAEGHAEDLGLLQGRASAQVVKLRFGQCSWSSQNPIHISNTVLPTVKSGPPEEARTLRKDRGTKDHRAPNHISKTGPPTVQLSPPNWTRTAVQTHPHSCHCLRPFRPQLSPRSWSKFRSDFCVARPSLRAHFVSAHLLRCMTWNGRASTILA